MKSERAKKIIDDDAVMMNNGDRMVDASTAYTAIDIAEQEAEERYNETVKALRSEVKDLEDECAYLNRIIRNLTKHHRAAHDCRCEKHEY